MSEIYFIRHAQTQWNADGRLQGRTDIPLSDEGRAQVQLLISHLRGLGVQRIISSPLKRTFETGKIIADALEIPIETDGRLIERNFGSFEGVYRQTLIIEYGLKPGQALSEVLPPDAELMTDVAARAWPAIEEFAIKPEKQLIVSHAGIFRALWTSRAAGKFSELKFGDVWRFENNGDVWSVINTAVDQNVRHGNSIFVEKK